MTEIAVMQEAVCQEQNHRFVSRPRAFRFPDDKPWHRLVSKVREVMVDWFQSITAAVMLVTFLLFAAMAIPVIIYVVLFLVAFILSILGMAKPREKEKRTQSREDAKNRKEKTLCNLCVNVLLFGKDFFVRKHCNELQGKDGLLG